MAKPTPAAAAEQPPLLCTISGPVATLVLNRPAQHNSANAAMLELLVTWLRDLNGPSHREVRVIVLTGNGRYFCTGMDLRQGAADASAGRGGLGAARPYGAFEALWRSPKPVVCALNGPAIAGGAGLLFATDVRIATDECFVSFPEVFRGIYPALISGYIAPQLGAYRTQALMLTGARMSAAELLAAGVVSHVVAPKDLAMRTAEVVLSLLKGPSNAHAGVKRVVRLAAYGGDNGHQEVMDGLVGEFTQMMAAPEARHGMRTFAKTKEAPNWEEFYAAEREKGEVKSGGKAGTQAANGGEAKSKL